MQRSCQTSVAALALVWAFGQPVLALVQDWQHISRLGSIAATRGDLLRAARLYQAAIARVQADEPGDEVIFDLLLNLAEVQMRAGHLSQAKLSLDKCSPVAVNRQWQDPLLPVRYYRKLAVLEEQCGHLPAAVRASASCLNITSRLFAPLSPAVDRAADNFSRLAALACARTRSYQDIQELLEAAELLSGPRSGAKHEVASALAERVRALPQFSDPDQTARLLTKLARDCKNPLTLAAAWQNWLTKLPAANSHQRLQAAQLAITSAFDQGNTNQAQMAIEHILLAHLYHLDGNPDGAAREIAAIKNTPGSLDESNWQFVHAYCFWCLGQAAGPGATRSPEDCRQLLQEACDLSALMSACLPDKDKKTFFYPWLAYRLSLAKLLVQMHHAGDAAQLMDTLWTVIAGQKEPAAVRRFIRTDARCARAQLVAGENLPAQARLAKLLKLAAGLPANQFRTRLLDWLKMCANPTTKSEKLDEFERLYLHEGDVQSSPANHHHRGKP